MKATLEIESHTVNIPLFIKILEWLQDCPVKELKIKCNTFWLQKETKQK